MNPLNTLSIAQLKQAIVIKEKMEALEQELAAVLGSQTTPTASAPAPVKARKGISAAGRARIAAAQKARWAKMKIAKTVAAVQKTAKTAKKKFTMSAAAKAAISKAAKARWAKIRAAKRA